MSKINLHFAELICGAVLVVACVGCAKSLVIPNPSYGIGVIDAYNPSDKQSNIQFHFITGNHTIYISYINGHNGWEVPKGKHYDIGEEFMIQYNPVKTSEAKMLFCYPVTDSTDYDNYFSQFIIKAPDCN